MRCPTEQAARRVRLRAGGCAAAGLISSGRLFAAEETPPFWETPAA
jgi:hypothetical protein